jgi:hypothetical protein
MLENPLKGFTEKTELTFRNLSDKLVNGLIGKVVSCGDDGPVVNFPSIDVTTKLDKINFSGNYLQFISICIILKGL